jgi:hypothetical protein
MKTDLSYVDEIYHFPGMWDVPSLCGLRIARHPDQHVVVATELFEQNPGTSVTNCCAQLANRLVAERGLDPDRLVFIEHSPETGSRLEFYAESFHRVTFRRDATGLRDPDWSELERAEVDRLLAGGGT